MMEFEFLGCFLAYIKEGYREEASQLDWIELDEDEHDAVSYGCIDLPT